MLITFGTKGQFGNAYLSSAYHLANALEYGYRLRLYNLGPYKDYLIGTDTHPDLIFGGKLGNLAGIGFGRAYKRLTRRKICQFASLRILNDQSSTYPLSAEQLGLSAVNGITISNGWKFRDRQALQKHAQTLREILGFKPEFQRAAAAKIKDHRRQASHLIAIHVRMGDYRSFRDGKYLFTPEEYLRVAASAVAASGHDPAKVTILLFSNERTAWPETINGAKVVTPAGTWWEDFLCISMCDLIIGPPSTFSGSASFLGDVPWFQIKDKDAPFDPAMARPYLQSGIRA